MADERRRLMAARPRDQFWHAGQGRQVPETFRTRAVRYRARAYRYTGVWTPVEQLCDHEHVGLDAAKACGVLLAAALNDTGR